MLHLTPQNSKCPRRFWETDPEILHKCLMCPSRAFFEWVFFCLVLFFAENVGSLKTQISPKKCKKPKYLNINITKKNRWRLGRGTLNTCAKFQGLTLKNGVDNWRLKEVGGLCLNQLVTATHPTRLGLKVHCISETLNVHYVPHQTGFLNL